jgi:ferrous iron transport protein A
MATTPDRCTAASDSIGLTDLPEGTTARVIRVSPGCDGAPKELSKRLAELGFLPGERVRIVGRGFFSREPLAVRIGTGTFALRLFEAACVQVCPEPAPAA